MQLPAFLLDVSLLSAVEAFYFLFVSWLTLVARVGVGDYVECISILVFLLAFPSVEELRLCDKLLLERSSRFPFLRVHDLEERVEPHREVSFDDLYHLILVFDHAG